MNKYTKNIIWFNLEKYITIALSAIRMMRNYAKHPHFIHFAVCLLFALVVSSPRPFSPGIPGDNKVAAKYRVTKWRAELWPELPCSGPGDSAHYLGLVLIEAAPAPAHHQTSLGCIHTCQQPQLAVHCISWHYCSLELETSHFLK